MKTANSVIGPSTPEELRTPPVFIGGTVLEHVLFVVSLCRYQHPSLPLCFVHYLTWSVVQISLFAIAFKLFGLIGAIVFGTAIAVWAMRMDVVVGALIGLLVLGYGIAAEALASGGAITTGEALACILAALVVEGSFHLVFQGRPPRPPPRNAIHLPSAQVLLVGLYFAVLFGLFFLTLDLAMRLGGYRRELNRRTNEITNDWHRIAADEAEKALKPSLRDWHVRAIAAQS